MQNRDILAGPCKQPWIWGLQGGPISHQSREQAQEIHSSKVAAAVAASLDFLGRSIDHHAFAFTFACLVLEWPFCLASGN